MCQDTEVKIKINKCKSLTLYATKKQVRCAKMLLLFLFFKNMQHIQENFLF